MSTATGGHGLVADSPFVSSSGMVIADRRCPLRFANKGSLTSRSMKCRFFVAVSIIFFGFPVRAEQPKALFYLTRDPKSVRSFLAHADKIDILVPTWYSVDANGLVSGGPNPVVLETARQHHVPIMPIVINNGFSQEDFHKLLMNRAAYETMASRLMAACKENGYIGIQFDFENVSWTDRSALSTMVSNVASEFH